MRFVCSEGVREGALGPAAPCCKRRARELVLRCTPTPSIPRPCLALPCLTDLPGNALARPVDRPTPAEREIVTLSQEGTGLHRPGSTRGGTTVEEEEGTGTTATEVGTETTALVEEVMRGTSTGATEEETAETEVEVRFAIVPLLRSLVALAESGLTSFSTFCRLPAETDALASSAKEVSFSSPRSPHSSPRRRTSSFQRAERNV